MLKGVKDGIAGAWDTLVEKANLLKKGSNKMIDSWLEVLPRISSYGFEINSFAMNYSLNPSMEVELVGNLEDFPAERISEIMKENKNSPAIRSVFQALKTTINLQKRLKETPKNEIVIEVRVSISPEIKVFLGVPLVE
ncbi:MAG: hypothetical protein R2769_01080 [Saprospiraceae bacterium]